MTTFAPMPATMMHMPMTVQMIMRHGAAVFPASVVAEYDGERVTDTSYADVAANAVRLANLLRELGVRPGDRVGTFSWNSCAHQEAYLAVPAMGAILHTVNVRLSTEQIAFVINHAEDRVLLVDPRLWPQLEPALPLLDTVEHLLLVGEPDGAGTDTQPVARHDYRDALASQPDHYPWPDIDENSAAVACYTSGTTGNPKGVVYSHKTSYLHAVSSRAVDTFAICERDRLLLVPPMFHANSWGMPYSGWFSGSDLILPGPFLQAEHLQRLIRDERPTFSAMVPTVLGDLLRLPEEELDMSCFRMLVSGGAAVPEAMIRSVRERWGVPLLQGWGMTETSPMCVLSHPPRELDGHDEAWWRAKSGRPVPGIEVRVVDEAGKPLPHDGATVGELQLRGPWVTGAYHAIDADSFTDDGWLRTGDVGHIDARHFVQLTDRTKDVIKSGGEWISSVDLENALAEHPGVAEAAVIAVPDERWQERPLAIVAGSADGAPAAEDLRAFLKERVARFWVPENWVFVDAIEKTSVGKIDKKRLRERRDAGDFAIQRVS